MYTRLSITELEKGNQSPILYCTIYIHVYCTSIFKKCTASGSVSKLLPFRIILFNE